MIDIFTLDVETASNDPANPQYALEPFRYKYGLARVTELSVSGPDNYGKLLTEPEPGEVSSVLHFLKGKIVYMHNAVFDTAWIYTMTNDIVPLEQISIRDTLLLAKWLLNSQSEQFKTKAAKDELGGYDLASLCKRFLDPNTPGLQDYLLMKAEGHVAGEDQEYWKQRALLDTIFTRLLAIELQNRLPAPQRNGFLISQKQIPYTARAWIDGIPFDYDKVKVLGPKIEAGKQSLASKLKLPMSAIQSGTQLSKILFEDWGLNPISRGKPKKGYPEGQGSTKADDLKMIALRAQGSEVGEKMKLIMQYKKLQTLQTKYLNGFERVHHYIKDDVCYGSPKIFGTYTGRYTYSSKTDRKQIFQISIAQHQLPRKGPAKSLMLPHEEMDVGKYDASGQEIAFMGNASKDANMIAVLCQGMNVHSWMATNITGEQYADFIKRLKDDPDAYNTRMAAKLLNLSCQYRIGWAAIQAKFFSAYDIIIDRAQSNRYLRIYKAAYPGVVDYWKDICVESQKKGYAETIAGRRYYLTDWGSHRWATESSAINMPVQGSGADQKDLVIWLVSEKFPEVRFALDVHDEGIFNLPQKHSEELNKDIVHFLNGIDYESYWDKEIPMPLNFEGQLGKNFKDCEEYAQPYNEIQDMRRSLGVRVYQ